MNVWKDIISAYDVRDPTSAIPEVRERSSKALNARLSRWDSEKAPEKPLKGLRIGVPQVSILREIVTNYSHIDLPRNFSPLNCRLSSSSLSGE
jgi:hypothetical protein